MRLILLLAFSAGCFDAGSAPVTCSKEFPACPDGQLCVDNKCEQASADLAAVADSGAVDMPAISGCSAGNGSPVGNRGVWACPGAFGGANPKAALLCKSGKVCADSSLITMPECADVKSAFFVSAVWGATEKKDPSVGECFSVSTFTPSFFGCGAGGFNVTKSCGGYVSVLQITPQNMLSSGLDINIDKLVNTNASNGVLCCP